MKYEMAILRRESSLEAVREYVRQLRKDMEK